METTQCIKERRSIRSFEANRISHRDFEAIVALAAYAPSWKNTQPARYTLIEDDNLIEALAEHCVMNFKYNANTIRNAPNVVILSIVTGRSGYERDGSFSTGKEDRWEVFDAGIAAQTFSLAAHEKGYGSVIMGYFDEDKVKHTVNLPDGQKVAAIIALGIPAETPAAPKRKEVQELVAYR